MIKSKAWDWKIVEGEDAEFWKTPNIESFYLIDRWLSQNKNYFLDLGCGLGRHTIQFAKAGFKTHAFDLSDKAIQSCEELAEKENLNIDFETGDMLKLPYENESMDCILCINVIYHTDTEGMKQVVGEIFRVLKKNGECYLTLGSKETWGYKQDWPVVDDNTKVRIEDGPENGIPHFYADSEVIFELFKDFQFITLTHMEDNIVVHPGSWHYHMLIRK